MVNFDIVLRYLFCAWLLDKCFQKEVSHSGSPRRTNEPEPLGTGPGPTFLTTSQAVLMQSLKE